MKLALVLLAAPLTPETWLETAPGEALQAVIESRDHPEKALALSSKSRDDPLVTWLKGRALLALGRDEEAAALLKTDQWFQGRCVPPHKDAPRLALLNLVDRSALSESEKYAWFVSTPAAPWQNKALSIAPDAVHRKELTLTLLKDFAGSKEASLVLRSSGRTMTSSSAAQVALSWLDAHKNSEAERIARRRLSASPEEGDTQCKLHYIVGKAKRKKRNYRSGLSALRKARKLCIEVANSELAIRASLLEAQILRILGRRASSILDLAEQVSGLDPNHSYIDDILLLASEQASRATQPALWKRIIEHGDDQAAVAAWRLGRQYLEDQRPNQALAAWQKVIALSEAGRADVDDFERARFFMAKTEFAFAAEHSELSRENAISIWESLARQPSFYGFLALSQLFSNAPKAGEAAFQSLQEAMSSTVSLSLVPRLAEHPAALRARRYLRVGMADWAVSELRELDCALSSRRPIEELQLAQLYQAAGALPEAQRLIRWRGRPYLERLTPKTAPGWRLAYTRAFDAPVGHAAEIEGVDPLLLMSLAREESTFDPEIVSWAGATGLTQLMPATAQEAYAEVFGGEVRPEQLLDPKLNLRLGAHVLAEALTAFGGSEALALSAYNGGVSLTQRILPTRPVPFEEWIESNPVRENRRYVKRVLASWGIYRLLHQNARPWPKVPKTVGPGAELRF